MCNVSYIFHAKLLNIFFFSFSEFQISNTKNDSTATPSKFYEICICDWGIQSFLVIEQQFLSQNKKRSYGITQDCS